MRIGRDGQITIPQHIREQAGLGPGADVVFAVVDGEVHLRRADKPSDQDTAHQGAGNGPTRGQKLVAVLKGSGRYPMPADALIALMRGPSADEETGDPASPAA